MHVHPVHPPWVRPCPNLMKDSASLHYLYCWALTLFQNTVHVKTDTTVVYGGGIWRGWEEGGLVNSVLDSGTEPKCQPNPRTQFAGGMEGVYQQVHNAANSSISRFEKDANKCAVYS